VIETSYDPAICDLCACREFRVIASVDTARGMTSDSRILPRSLNKIICQNCGLVRNGNTFAATDLEEHYGNFYQLNTNESGEEHVFYTASGPIPRSQLIHDWILQIKPAMSGRVLEVGCGQGSVLERVAASFPSAKFSGIDLNETAVTRATRKGLDVDVASSRDISGYYDTIIAFGVLEHVAHPTAFLQDLRAHLSEGGDLVIGQPMQDAPGYDLFFVDHLHHFTMEHVRALGAKVGLEQSQVIAGCALVPNFSLHRLHRVERQNLSVSFQNPLSLESVKQYFAAFTRIDNVLHEHPKIAVFGTGEVFALMYAYSNLAHADIICGLDDNRDRRENHHWPFPVILPDKARDFSVNDVLLSINPRYNQMVSKRLLQMGLNPISVL
jgi:2-polyprenyl-3-methyl-5-hydroxy-6-metoxy-1,4-benzoquinol methylase